MIISIITDRDSWINKRLASWEQALSELGHIVKHVHEVTKLAGGEICFILSFSQIIREEHLALHKHNLVVHESNLPNGKGWSPLTWQIILGENHIPITLFEANATKVDAGKIYLQDMIHLEGHELIEEIRDAQVNKTIELCQAFLAKYPKIISNGVEQHGQETFFKRRKPEDSELELLKSIEENFNLLRVVDNDKYPAFFYRNGIKYFLRISKAIQKNNA
jgi:methionyl-tRNA formyltransferase